MKTILWTATIMLLVALVIPATAAMEVILDNTSAALVGTWTTATSATNKYGADYLYCSIATSGSRTATFTPTIPVTATDWQAFVRYPTVSSAYSATRHIVHHAGGDTTVNVNQTTGVGTWVSLGTFTMNAGAGNYTRITNYGTSTSKRAVVDAVRYYSASATDTTPPVITNVSVSAHATYAVITWTTDENATSQVEYGFTSGYGSQTAKDTNLVKSHSVTVTGLTPQTLYHYRVKSEDAYGNLRVSGDYTFTTTALIPEFRSVWINTWNNGILSSAQNTALVNMTKAANYNVLIPEVRKSGDAYYVSSPIYCPVCRAYHQEPRASNIIDPLPFDPLQDLINKAHAQGMQVHAWLVTYRIWRTGFGTPPANHIWAVHPNWAMLDSAGGNLDGSSYDLDPGVPAVQDYLTKVAMDIVTRYDVDGLNWDYIRYPGYYWGYNAITQERFRQEYGYYPPTDTADSHWPVWAQFKRRQVTDLIKKVYLEMMAVKPHVNHSVDTVGWMRDDPNINYEGTRQYEEVCQDAGGWMEQHIIDTNILMNYKREYETVDPNDQRGDYRLWTTWLATKQSQTGRFSIDGQGAYLNSITDTITQMQVARSAGLGNSTYDYNTTNKDGQPASDFFNAVKANIHQDPAPVPEMTWKTNPTGGIIFGTVTDASHPNNPIYLDWVYKATVSVSGPAIQNTQTDATGTYGFIDLPPGTYNITFSKAGFPTQTITGVTLAAGQVVRKNAELGLTTVTSPAGTVVNGWSLLSVPLQPVNPAPESVFSGIDLDGKLQRWDNPTQALLIYDPWGPEAFGNIDVESGYWLESSAPATISYQAYPSSAATHDIPLPKAGWAIIGCPFLSDRQWANTTVKHGTQTVSMLTAAHTNNWMNSTGYWWDASTQALMDYGLPEDFATCEILQPWHGYWVETYVDDITLTLQ